MKFNTLKLKDIASEDRKAIISGPFGSDISSKFFQENGVPVIRGNNLSNNAAVKFKDDGFAYLTEEKADELNAYAIRNDLIFTAAGTIGQVGLIEERCKYFKYVISNKQIRVRLNLEKVNPFYAYYWFSSPWVVKDIVNKNTGSTVPLINLTIIKELEIKLPVERLYQDKIASVLSALDSKIELNNRINAELEAMAKTLYDYWFVQFDFPNENGKPYKTSGGKMVWNAELKREIPEGWEVKDLSEIANITTGKLDSNAEIIGAKYPFYTCAAEPSTTDTYAFDDTVILVAGNNASGNFHINRHKGKFNAYQRTYIFTSKKSSDLEHLYQVLKTETKLLKSQGKGSQTKFLTIGMLTGIKIIKNQDLFDKYDVLVKPLYEYQVNIRTENQKLAELRDWLLPMLMNGQVKVQ